MDLSVFKFLSLIRDWFNSFLNFLSNWFKKKNALKFMTKQQGEESYLYIHQKENAYSITLNAYFYVTNEGDLTRLLQPPECLVLKTRENGIGLKLKLSHKSHPLITVENKSDGSCHHLPSKTISNIKIVVDDQDIKSKKFQRFVKRLGPFVWVKLKVKDNLGFTITIPFRARAQIITSKKGD